MYIDTGENEHSRFNPYTTKNPSLTMPKYYCNAGESKEVRYADEEWIACMLNILNEESRNNAAIKYSILYREAYLHTSNPLKKESTARFTANEYIRSIADEQRENGTAAVFNKSAKSWEVAAHIQTYPDDILNFEDPHYIYVEMAVAANPSILFELHDPGYWLVEETIVNNPQLTVEAISHFKYNHLLILLVIDENPALKYDIITALQEAGDHWLCKIIENTPTT